MRTTQFNPLLSMPIFQAWYMHVRYTKDGHREEKISRKKFIRGFKIVREL